MITKGKFGRGACHKSLSTQYQRMYPIDATGSIFPLQRLFRQSPHARTEPASNQMIPETAPTTGGYLEENSSRVALHAMKVQALTAFHVVRINTAQKARVTGMGRFIC